MLKLIVNLQTASRFAINRLKDERGATAVEYALIVGGIAVVVLGAVQLLGGGVSTLFGKITTALGNL